MAKVEVLSSNEFLYLPFWKLHLKIKKICRYLKGTKMFFSQLNKGFLDIILLAFNVAFCRFATCCEVHYRLWKSPEHALRMALWPATRALWPTIGL